jgi:hypothetical protein
MTTINDILADLETHVRATEAENEALKGLLYGLGKQAESILDAIAQFGDKPGTVPAETEPMLEPAPAPVSAPQSKAPTSRGKYTDEQVIVWIKRREAGETYNAIADELNTTGWTIKQRIERYHEQHAPHCKRCDIVLGSEEPGVPAGRDGLCGYCTEDLDREQAHAKVA